MPRAKTKDIEVDSKTGENEYAGLYWLYFEGTGDDVTDINNLMETLSVIPDFTPSGDAEG